MDDYELVGKSGAGRFEMLKCWKMECVLFV